MDPRSLDVVRKGLWYEIESLLEGDAPFGTGDTCPKALPSGRLRRAMTYLSFAGMQATLVFLTLPIRHHYTGWAILSSGLTGRKRPPAGYPIARSALDALQDGLAGLHPDQRLVEFAENTRYFHHQIRIEGGRAVGYARSMMSRGKKGSDQWTLQSVKISLIADTIDKAIRWIDSHSDTGKRAATKEREHLVRSLIIPQSHLHAFWLEGQDADQILVVDSPKSTPGLKLRHLYGWFEFFEALSKLRLRSNPTSSSKI